MIQESKKPYLEAILEQAVQRETDQELVLPSEQELAECVQALPPQIPHDGIGLEETYNHLVTKVIPALNNQSQRHYYGFVTGGVTPAAHLADNIVSMMDQNVQVHLPAETVSTTIEDCALKMLLELIQLDKGEFTGRTLTTGATASNILALACGREGVLTKALNAKGVSQGVADLGLVKAMRLAELDNIQILACSSHSSLAKAASVVGLGRSSLVDCKDDARPWDFDLKKVEQHLATPNIATIVAVNFGEVNTGMYTSNLSAIRELCVKYNAWMHVDGAFGVFERSLIGTESKYSQAAAEWTNGLELADSITGDCHKTLNVPYDCGFYFTKSVEVLQQVMQNAGAAYLQSGPNASIASPLNIGIENSRRFRALPVYSTLLAYGKCGYRQFMERLIDHTREVAQFVESSDDYELLPHGASPEDLSTVVLLRAKHNNDTLKQRINATGKMYVSGTAYDGQPAIRIAVCNWAVGLDANDASVPIQVLKSVA